MRQQKTDVVLTVKLRMVKDFFCCTVFKNTLKTRVTVWIWNLLLLFYRKQNKKGWVKTSILMECIGGTTANWMTVKSSKVNHGIKD